ncbi:MAG: hypothetical protein D6732_24415 [Methanobacteriota archaeon]|nr:MAG: hypothetical protein D6732_24415 [Euryarchaeota archaeon]
MNANTIHKLGDIRNNPMVLMTIFDVASSVLSQQERSRLISMFASVFSSWKLRNKADDVMHNLYRAIDVQIAGNDALARWFNIMFMIINTMIDETKEDDIYIELKVDSLSSSYYEVNQDERMMSSSFSNGRISLKVYA